MSDYRANAEGNKQSDGWQECVFRVEIGGIAYMIHESGLVTSDSPFASATVIMNRLPELLAKEKNKAYDQGRCDALGYPSIAATDEMIQSRRILRKWLRDVEATAQKPVSRATVEWHGDHYAVMKDGRVLALGIHDKGKNNWDIDRQYNGQATFGLTISGLIAELNKIAERGQ